MSKRTNAVTYTEVFGHVLRTLREAGSPPLSVGAMAKAMGKTRPAWSYVEAGRNTLDPAQVAVAAQVLGVSPGEIFARTDAICRRLRAEGRTVHMQRRPRDPDQAHGLGLALTAGAVGALLGGVVAHAAVTQEEDGDQ